MKAKKSLGQNFLRSKSVVNKAIVAGQVADNDLVLEIGPGKGFLTEELIKTARQVVAIEKDKRMIDLLQIKFAKEIKTEKLHLIEGDCLEMKIENLFKNKKYKLIANIPYYITGAVIKKFLTDKLQPVLMVLLVQKEVADRIVNQKKQSLLSLSVKVYGQPKKISKVPAQMFSPAPKVDSALLLIDDISKEFFSKNQLNEKVFFNLLKTGFQSKRKTLINNLKSKKGPQNNWINVFDECNLNKMTRAEDLTLNDWLCLGLHLKN